MYLHRKAHAQTHTHTHDQYLIRMHALYIMHMLNLHTHIHGTQASLLGHPAGGRASPSADVIMGEGVDQVPHANHRSNKDPEVLLPLHFDCVREMHIRNTDTHTHNVHICIHTYTHRRSRLVTKGYQTQRFIPSQWTETSSVSAAMTT